MFDIQIDTCSSELHLQPTLRLFNIIINLCYCKIGLKNEILIIGKWFITIFIQNWKSISSSEYLK